MKTIRSDTEHYFRIRDAWLDQHLPRTGVTRYISEQFRVDIAQYNARIDTTRDPDIMYGADTLGMIIGHDYLVFDSDYDYMLFCIRYA